MYFNQILPDGTSRVVANSFFATGKLQHMSRRHIMSLSVKIAGIVGLASDSLLGTVSANMVMLNQEKNVSPTLLSLGDWHCGIIEFPEHYYFFCGYSDLPIEATA